MTEGQLRRVAIETVSRIEGDAKITILLDEQGRVAQARLHVVEFRGFERFVQGRPYWEVPVIVERLCGICPVSHHLAAAKAMDRIIGADVLPPTAVKMRRLMHHAQILQSHATHFFHLASPDLLFGFEAPAERRSIVTVARELPDVARQGITLRRFGQELIRATGGKRIHPTGAVPGGVNRNLPLAERDRFLAEIEQIAALARRAVKLARDYTLEHREELAQFDAFPSNHLALVGPRGELDLYDGALRAVAPRGELLFEEPSHRYAELIGEGVQAWSYMCFPFIRSLGSEDGWYRVGPLARLNTCTFIPTPEAEQARLDYAGAMGGLPCNVTMAQHWARMIELLHAVEVIALLLEDADLQGKDLVTRGERRGEAVAAIEAPRGTLIHQYAVDEQDRVTSANLLVATTQNNEAMNRTVQNVARRSLAGRPEITEGMLNRIEVGLRAYDPCLSCATHALGRMPLVVELVGANTRER